MMYLEALIVGFVFVSFVQDSFEVDQLSVPLPARSDLKAAGRSFRERVSICESLCRSKRQNTPHFEKETSSDVCTRKCIQSERAGESFPSLEKMETLRSRRNTNNQQELDNEDDCLQPKLYANFDAREPSKIIVDFSRRTPNLSITWTPVRTGSNYNWTSYALHYYDGDGSNYCKLIPKGQHEWIIRDGDGWKYPDVIFLGIVTYPHSQFYEVKLEKYVPPQRAPPTIPTTTKGNSTKLIIIAACSGVAIGLALLVFAFLVYRKRINICSPCSRADAQREAIVQMQPSINNPCMYLTDDVDDPAPMPPRIMNNLQLRAPENNTSAPDTFYACYFKESEWFQVQVASVVNYFRQNGYEVAMDAMNSNEFIDLGPNRWAEQQIKKARNILVFLSPGLLRLCGGDGEDKEFIHQENERLWVELDLLRKMYSQTRSARKMVCIILPNMLIDPRDLPLWAEMRYRWPEDQNNILQRLNDRPIIQPW